MQLRRVRRYGEMAALAGVYLAAAWAVLGLGFAMNNITAISPPTGIALAVLLLRGPALWPGIVVGSFLANWLTHTPILPSVGVGLGDALECVAAVWLLRRFRISNSLDHSRDVAALLFAAVLFAPVSATVGTASLLAGGVIAAAGVQSRWLTWCFGDASGVILVAPVVLTWFCRPRPLRGAAGPMERAALLATLALVVFLVFGEGYPHLYPVFPVLVWAGLRGGTRLAASASLFISAASVLFTLQGRSLPGTGDGIYHVLAFDALAGATALMLAAAVVEREAARGEEKRSLNLLEALFSGMAARVFVKDLAGRYLMVNPVAAGTLGAPAREIIGHTDLDLLASDAWPSARAADRAVIATGQARTLEERFQGPGGAQTFLTTLGPFRDASGRVAGVVGIARDISARKHIEDRLRESEEKFRSLVENAPDYICTMDREGRVLFVNRLAPGLAMDQVLGSSGFDFVVPEDRETARRSIDQVFRTGQPLSYEIRAAGPWGAVSWYRCSAAPLRNGGEVASVILVVTDVTEHRQIEERLRESEEKFRSLVESASDYICTFDEQGRFLFLNRAAPGFDAAKMIGTTVYEYSDREHHETIRRSIAEVFRTGQPGGYEIRGMGVDGAPTWYRCAVAPLMEDGRVRAVMVTSNDITERRNMEEKLRESEEQFRSLVENAPDFISTFGADGRIWFLNRAAPGHDVSMFIGRNAYEFIPPADQERVRGMLDQVFGSGATVTYETGWKVGGGPVRSFRCRVGPMRKNGSVVAALVVSTDITESQRAEQELKLSRERLQRLSRRLIEAQETERSHIARELHDEIGQALTAVKISLQAAESRSDSAAVRSRLEESATIVDEALDQVRNMSVALRPSLLDDLGLVPALRWYLDQQSARGGFEAHFEADPEIEATSEVQTACFRIAQEALTNVSRHAAASRVRLEVHQAGGRLHLAVSDDGKGFDVARVFERYGADASLGLHGMRERARLLGGRVTVQSGPESGTVVRAEFPSEIVEG